MRREIIRGWCNRHRGGRFSKKLKRGIDKELKRLRLCIWVSGMSRILRDCRWCSNINLSTNLIFNKLFKPLWLLKKKNSGGKESWGRRSLWKSRISSRSQECSKACLDTAHKSNIRRDPILGILRSISCPKTCVSAQFVSPTSTTTTRWSA